MRIRSDRRERSLPRLFTAALGAAMMVACGTDEHASSDEARAVAVGANAATGAMGAVPLDISAEIEGDSYRVSGPGQCTFAKQAYIRGVPSAMWQVRYSGDDGDISHMSLTIWRPEGGGVDQLSLSVQVDSETHRIDTVVGSEPAGSGGVVVRPEGEGARFTVDGRDSGGRPVSLTIACPRLEPAVAEGG